MKQILGLIYIPVVSRSVSRVKEFRRCPEHDNLLAYEGKALSLEEFNRVAPRVMGAGATGIYGVQPIAKLVEIEVPTCEAKAVPSVQSAVPAAAAAPTQTQLQVEPCGDGFVVVDYSGAAASYMGQAQTFENDVSLVMPFATEEDARAACPGVAFAKDSPPVDSGAIPPQVETEAPVLEGPAASVSPVVQPRRMRHAVAAHQAAKRAAKAGPKVTPPTK